MKTCRSSLSIQRVLEFKVKQRPVSNATISQFFTFCKRVGMFFSTIHVEKPVASFQHNLLWVSKRKLRFIGTTYHVREKAGSLRNEKLPTVENNPGQ